MPWMSSMAQTSFCCCCSWGGGGATCALSCRHCRTGRPRPISSGHGSRESARQSNLQSRRARRIRFGWRVSSVCSRVSRVVAHVVNRGDVRPAPWLQSRSVKGLSQTTTLFEAQCAGSLSGAIKSLLNCACCETRRVVGCSWRQSTGTVAIGKATSIGAGSG